MYAVMLMSTILLFGAAIITRVLEAHGYKIGFIAPAGLEGMRRVFRYLVCRDLVLLFPAGNMDSMVNHYTVSKKRRSSDAYTPGGIIGKRPDYATIVYCKSYKKSL